MEISESEKLARAEWEFNNNPSSVTVRIPEWNGLQVSVNVLLLIAPEEFAGFQNNRHMRKLAIEQGSFKPAPNTCDAES
jgi:hypothetical protein